MARFPVQKCGDQRITLHPSETINRIYSRVFDWLTGCFWWVWLAGWLAGERCQQPTTQVCECSVHVASKSLDMILWMLRRFIWIIHGGMNCKHQAINITERKRKATKPPLPTTTAAAISTITTIMKNSSDNNNNNNKSTTRFSKNNEPHNNALISK